MSMQVASGSVDCVATLLSAKGIQRLPRATPTLGTSLSPQARMSTCRITKVRVDLCAFEYCSLHESFGITTARALLIIMIIVMAWAGGRIIQGAHGGQTDAVTAPCRVDAGLLPLSR
jgi:hypothetical protein